MNADELYFETGVKVRTPYRQYFKGWEAAFKSATWWANTKNEVYISVYGYTSLISNGVSLGFDRDVMPDYNTAYIDKIFLDIDLHKKDHGVEIEIPEAHDDVLRLEEWLDINDYRRRYGFSGAGYHVLIGASGSVKKIDVAHIFLRNEAKVNLDFVFDKERMRRFPGSYNWKRKAWCIPITTDELYLEPKRLWEIAQQRRVGQFPAGSRIFDIDGIQGVSTAQYITLGQYSRKVVSDDLAKVLESYGLNWDIDFCPAMKRIIEGGNPSNFERLQMFKYLRSILGVPFVDAIDENKTVINLFWNLIDDKHKARHAIKMREAESVYKRGRVFNPFKLKELGYCPQQCKECLERRCNNGRDKN